MQNSKRRQNQEEDLSGFGLKAKLATGIVTILGVATAFKFGQSLFKDSQESTAFSTSGFKGTPEYYAMRLRFAVTTWKGTDEDEIFSVAREMKSTAQWRAVQNAYSKLYRGDILMKDLQNDLNSEEYFQLIEILNSK